MKQQAERINFKPFEQTIKSTREKKGLTRKELAAQIRISPRYIASIENSEQTPQPASFLSSRHLFRYVRRFIFLRCLTSKSVLNKSLVLLSHPCKKSSSCFSIRSQPCTAGKSCRKNETGCISGQFINHRMFYHTEGSAHFSLKQWRKLMLTFCRSRKRIPDCLICFSCCIFYHFLAYHRIPSSSHIFFNLLLAR